MQTERLRVADAAVLTPRQHRDERGTFLEWYTADALREAFGSPLELAQANCSVSGRGVLRGIHFADVPPGQAKYITCVTGAVLDVVVDLRVGSPTFGAWDAVRLDPVDRRAVFVPEGIGHAFLSLEESSTVIYLCSTPYTPGAEHEVLALDPAIGIEWPTDIDPVLSDKDRAAPTLGEALGSGLLPLYENCQRHYDTLRASRP